MKLFFGLIMTFGTMFLLYVPSPNFINMDIWIGAFIIAGVSITLLGICLTFSGIKDIAEKYEDRD